MELRALVPDFETIRPKANIKSPQIKSQADISGMNRARIRKAKNNKRSLTDSHLNYVFIPNHDNLKMPEQHFRYQNVEDIQNQQLEASQRMMVNTIDHPDGGFNDQASQQVTQKNLRSESFNQFLQNDPRELQKMGANPPDAALQDDQNGQQNIKRNFLKVDSNNQGVAAPSRFSSVSGRGRLQDMKEMADPNFQIVTAKQLSNQIDEQRLKEEGEIPYLNQQPQQREVRKNYSSSSLPEREPAEFQVNNGEKVPQDQQINGTQFQNQALRQGLKEQNSSFVEEQARQGSGNERQSSRNKRQVYSKESNKVQMQIPLSEPRLSLNQCQFDNADQADFIDQSPENSAFIAQQMAKSNHHLAQMNDQMLQFQQPNFFKQTASAAFKQPQFAKGQFGDTFQQFVSNSNQIGQNYSKINGEMVSQIMQRGKTHSLEEQNDEMELKLKETMLKNPNYILDQDFVRNASFNEIAHQKGLIQKDGNIMLSGLLIKGAPSLGTKFNPNFRDPHHGPAGGRPQSRGLTQGNIIQIASKALASLNTSQQRRLQSQTIAVVDSVPYSMQDPSFFEQQQSKMQSHNGRFNTIDSKLSKRKQGKNMKKGQSRHGERQNRYLSGQQNSKHQNNISASIGSMPNNDTRKNDKIHGQKQIIKIQGEPEKSYDKVKLNVKFNKLESGQVFYMQDLQLKNQNMNTKQSALRMQNNKNLNWKTLMSNDSQPSMKDKQIEKAGVYKVAGGLGENNSSADEDNTSKLNLKERLQITASQSPSPNNFQFEQKHSQKNSQNLVAKMQVMRQSGTDTENLKDFYEKSDQISIAMSQMAQNTSQLGKIKSGMCNLTDMDPILTNKLNQAKSGANIMMQARRSQKVEQANSNTNSANRNNHFSASSSAAGAMSLDLNQLKLKEIDFEVSKQVSFDKSNAVVPRHLHQAYINQPAVTVFRNQNRKVLKPNQLQTKKSKDGIFFKTSQVRKGQPIKDFIKQIISIEQADAFDKIKFQYAQTPVNVRATYNHYNRTPQVVNSAIGQTQLNQLSIDQLIVRPFLKSNQNKSEEKSRGSTIKAGTITSAKQVNGKCFVPQEHEIISSNQQLNSAISEDKIKTEKIGEHTVSPENTQRQEFNQNISNLNVNEDLNEPSATAQQLQSVRLDMQPRRLLIEHSNKLSLPISMGKDQQIQSHQLQEINLRNSPRQISERNESNQRSKKENELTSPSNDIEMVGKINNRYATKTNSKRVIVTHTTLNQQKSGQRSEQVHERGSFRASEASNSRQSKTLIVEILPETCRGQKLEAVEPQQINLEVTHQQELSGSQKRALEQIAYSQQIDTMDHVEASYQNIHMKPKGILNIFDAELLSMKNEASLPEKSESDQAQQKGAKYQLNQQQVQNKETAAKVIKNDVSQTKNQKQQIDAQQDALNLNLNKVSNQAKDEISFNLNQDKLVSRSPKRQPVCTSREHSQRDGPISSKTSKIMSKIISESMLDCRDIGIGTGVFNEDDIDMLKINSRDNQKGSGPQAHGAQKYRTRQSNDYKPIQQVNVQLVNQNANYLNESRSRKSGAGSRNKSSIHEKTSILRSDIGMDSTIPPSESPISVMTNRKIRNIDNFSSEIQSNQYKVNDILKQQMQLVQLNQKMGSNKMRMKNERSETFDSKKRPKRLHDYLGKQRRVIQNSPNPNDRKIIKIGQIVQEADTLLNGKIHRNTYIQRTHQDFQLNEKELRSLVQTEILKQKDLSVLNSPQKTFTLEGKHIDARDSNVKQQFESVTSKAKKNANEQLVQQINRDQNENSKVDLQIQLKTLSLEQLQRIHEILCQGGQIVKSYPSNQSQPQQFPVLNEFGQQILSLSSLGNKNGQILDQEHAQDKLRIIDSLQTQVKEQFDPQQFSDSVDFLKGNFGLLHTSDAVHQDLTQENAQVAELHKRQNSSKQSQCNQLMGARFQGVSLAAATGEASSGLTQTGSVSQSQPRRGSSGREANQSFQNNKMQDCEVKKQQGLPQPLPNQEGIYEPNSVYFKSQQRVRNDNRTVLGIDKRNKNWFANLQLEDDQTDNQTVYLHQTKKINEPMPLVDTSQLSSVKSKQQQVLDEQSFASKEQDNDQRLQRKLSYHTSIEQTQLKDPNQFQTDNSNENKLHQETINPADGLKVQTNPTCNQILSCQQSFGQIWSDDKQKDQDKLLSETGGLTPQNQGLQNQDRKVSKILIDRQGDQPHSFQTNQSHLRTLAPTSLDSTAKAQLEVPNQIQGDATSVQISNPKEEGRNIFKNMNYQQQQEIRNSKQIAQPTAQIQVSRKSQPLVDTSNITYDNAHYLKQQLQKQSQIQLAIQQSKQEASLACPSSVNKTVSLHGTQRLGKKTLVHADQAQYELYIQLQQMKKIGDQLREGQLLMEQNKNNESPLKSNWVSRSKQSNTIFGKVSQVMKRVFSPQEAAITSERGLNMQIYRNRYNLKIKRNSNEEKQKDLQKQMEIMSKTIDPDTERQMKNGNKKLTAGKNTETGKEVLGSGANQSLSVMNEYKDRRCLSTDLKSVSLYQQSFNPATRMIQKQKFMRQYDQMQNNRTKHSVKVITPPGLRKQCMGVLSNNSLSFNLAFKFSEAAMHEAQEETRNSVAKNAAAPTVKSTITGGASTQHGRGSVTPIIGSGAPSVSYMEFKQAQQNEKQGPLNLKKVSTHLKGSNSGTERKTQNLKIDALKANKDIIFS